MHKWEYLRLSTTYEDLGENETRSVTWKIDGRRVEQVPADEALVALGEEGWELVAAFGASMNNGTLLFKHPK